MLKARHTCVGIRRRLVSPCWWIGNLKELVIEFGLLFSSWLLVFVFCLCLDHRLVVGACWNISKYFGA